MKLKSFQVCALLASLSLGLSSCGSTGTDATNPTVSQMDRLDAQWGLPPRQIKGSPSRRYAPAPTQDNLNAPATAPSTYAPSAPVIQAPSLQPAEAAPAPITIPSGLR